MVQMQGGACEVYYYEYAPTKQMRHYWLTFGEESSVFFDILHRLEFMYCVIFTLGGLPF